MLTVPRLKSHAKSARTTSSFSAISPKMLTNFATLTSTNNTSSTRRSPMCSTASTLAPSVTPAPFRRSSTASSIMATTTSFRTTSRRTSRRRSLSTRATRTPRSGRQRRSRRWQEWDSSPVTGVSTSMRRAYGISSLSYLRKKMLCPSL
jgi:hypothetical protein